MLTVYLLLNVQPQLTKLTFFRSHDMVVRADSDRGVSMCFTP